MFTHTFHSQMRILLRLSHFFSFNNCDLAFVSYYVLLLNGIVIMCVFLCLCCCDVTVYSVWVYIIINTNILNIHCNSNRKQNSMALSLTHCVCVSVCVSERDNPMSFVMILTHLAFNSVSL